MVAVLGLVSLPLQSANSQSSQSSATDGLAGHFPGPNGPWTVNTIAYVEHAVQANLVLPNASVLGPGFRIVGARVATYPTNQNDTITGTTFKYWTVAIYITSQPFVNGTTAYDAFFSGTIIVTEAAAAPGGNSYTVAEGQLQPQQACEGSNPNGTSAVTTSCSVIVGPSMQIVQVGTTYLAVTPSDPMAFFLIAPDGPVVTIDGTSLMTFQQMMTLASDMISQSA